MVVADVTGDGGDDGGGMLGRIIPEPHRRPTGLLSRKVKAESTLMSWARSWTIDAGDVGNCSEGNSA